MRRVVESSRAWGVGSGQTVRGMGDTWYLWNNVIRAGKETSYRLNPSP